MRCHDIDAIIDDHRVGTLDPVERIELHAHLDECRRCTAAWCTNEALRGETLAAPPPGLFAATVRYAEARLAAEPARTEQRWPVLAGLAALLLIAMLFAFVAPRVSEPEPTPAGAVAGTLIEGLDYRILPAAARTPARDAGLVEVVQLFTYDCRLCYEFEHPWMEWTERHRGDVVLVRVPVQWNMRAERHARAYYTAEALGKAADLQLPFFDEIHLHGNLLDSDDALAELFMRFGVERTAFDRAYGSAAVDRAVAEARALVERYGVTGVPTLVVGGELVITAGMAGSPVRLVDVVEALVQCVQARSRRATAREVQHC